MMQTLLVPSILQTKNWSKCRTLASVVCTLYNYKSKKFTVRLSQLLSYNSSRHPWAGHIYIPYLDKGCPRCHWRWLCCLFTTQNACEMETTSRRDSRHELTSLHPPRSKMATNPLNQRNRLYLNTRNILTPLTKERFVGHSSWQTHMRLFWWVVRSNF